jgi:hypothetical protein
VGNQGALRSSPPSLCSPRSQILQWYKQREYDVTPVHPRETELEGLQAVKSLSEVPQLASTSVSVITPPPVCICLFLPTNMSLQRAPRSRCPS